MRSDIPFIKPILIDPSSPAQNYQAFLIKIVAIFEIKQETVTGGLTMHPLHAIAL